MAGPTTAAKNIAADAVAAQVTEISIHSADPGAGGTSEIQGGAYARATAFTYGGAAGGTADLAGTKPTYDMPPSVQLAFYGLWAGATFLGGQALDVPVTVGSAGGTFTLNSAPVDG